MPDPRCHSAWHAEQQRQLRRLLAYWRGNGEAYLVLCMGTYAFLALAVLVVR